MMESGGARGPPRQRRSYRNRNSWVASTTVLQSIIRSPANVHTTGTAVVEAAREPGAHMPWRWTWAHGVQAAPGVPRGVKPLGRGAARRKARGSGGENLARSAARKAY